MSDRLPVQELESYLWGAATILRGLIEAGDYKQYVFPLLFFKRLSDVWDEDYTAALADTDDADYARATANDRFVIPEGAHWNDVRTVARDVGQAIRDAMRAIEAANPGRLADIFGDAPWTNKSRLPDATLKNLLEHFSQQTLSLARVPEDELGVAYEYLIGKFADDSGHTAQEFYTNRTVVHLMVQMLDPQPGEAVYDPTAGTAGMLISTIDQVKRNGGEYRTLHLYGQERNHMTASIARMNLALHGVENFAIARGDTLERPAFVQGDRLRTFPHLVEAEKATPPAEDEDRGKAALTELFEAVRNPETPIIVERIVAKIDEIVRLVRFPGWQTTSEGEREVRKALRRTLFDFKLHQDAQLFDKAYGYVKEYY